MAGKRKGARLMELKLELGASSLALNDKGMTVHIASWHFTPKQWRRVVGRQVQAREQLEWLQLPFQTAEQEGARWKKITLDVCSQVIYVLLIDPGHKLVQLLQAIDWGEIDRRCAEVYENGERGARAYAPQVLFRMLLLMALYGLCFESSLVEQIETQMAWRWFCGFGVLTTIPRAATLCYFRQRLGSAKFVEILVWLIQQCEQAGMISWQEAYFDFTGVAASATQLTPYQRTVVLAQALDTYLAGLEDGSITEETELKPILRQLIIEAAQTVMSAAHPSVKECQPQSLSRSLDRLNERVAAMPRGPRWWQQIRQTLQNWRQQEQATAQESQSLLRQLAQTSQQTDQSQPILLALKEQLCQVGRALTPTIPHAWGDLSARVGTLSTGRSICGYLAGYLVDSRCNVIVGLVSVAANTAQAPQVKLVVNQVKDCLGRLPRRLGLDSAFDRDQVYLDLQDEPIELFIVSRSHRTTKGRFSPESFCFNAADQLCCPAGQPMRLRYGPYKNGRSIFEGQGCATCPLQAQCVPEGKSVRRFQVKLDSHRRWLQNRVKSHSPQGRRLLLQRFVREGVFGHANTYHNGDRAPYRDGAMNAIAACLTAFVVNLEKLAAHQAATAAA
jgi:transposase